MSYRRPPRTDARSTYTTPNYQFPYPDSNEPVAGGAAAIQALAEAIDRAFRIPIADTGELTGGQTIIDLANIPQTCKHLQIDFWLRPVSTGGPVWITFNGDTTGAYFNQNAASGGIRVDIPYSGLGNALNNPAAFGFVRLIIPNYCDGIGGTAIRYRTAFLEKADGYTGGYTHIQWVNTAAINRVTATIGAPGYLAGSRAQIIGVN
jgi:hypothetical protein